MKSLLRIALMGILIIAFWVGAYIGIASTLQDREAWMAKHPRWRMELFVLENTK
jgi:hypothetical protein